MCVVGPLKLYILSNGLLINHYLFMCGLFNNCVNTSEYIKLNDECYMNNDLERIQMEAAVA
jgi:hypothetical protein